MKPPLIYIKRRLFILLSVNEYLSILFAQQYGHGPLGKPGVSIIAILYFRTLTAKPVPNIFRESLLPNPQPMSPSNKSRHMVHTYLYC